MKMFLHPSNEAQCLELAYNYTGISTQTEYYTQVLLSSFISGLKPQVHNIFTLNEVEQLKNKNSKKSIIIKIPQVEELVTHSTFSFNTIPINYCQISHSEKIICIILSQWITSTYSKICVNI